MIQEYYWAHKTAGDPSLFSVSEKTLYYYSVLNHSSGFLDCYLLEACSKAASWCPSAALGCLPLNCPALCCSSSSDIRWPKKEKEVVHGHCEVMSKVLSLHCCSWKCVLEFFTLYIYLKKINRSIRAITYTLSDSNIL